MRVPELEGTVAGGEAKAWRQHEEDDEPAHDEAQ
jgi:hypothetical protein